MRTFFAIPLDKTTTKTLLRCVQPLKSRFNSAVHWTDSAQWHITLKFFASINPHDLERFCKRIGEYMADASSFSLMLNKIAVFPNAKGRYLTAYALYHEGLIDMNTRFNDEAVQLGYGDDAYRFLPHVTLAKSQVPLIMPAYRMNLSIPVREVVLYESHLGHYAILQRFKLAK